MDKSFAKYPQLWFVCKFCKRAFSEIQKLKAHKRHEHFAQLKKERRRKRREERIAQQESLSETLTEIIPVNSELNKREDQQELPAPVPVPVAVSPGLAATASLDGSILKFKNKARDPFLAFVNVKRLSPKAIETALSPTKNNIPRFDSKSKLIEANNGPMLEKSVRYTTLSENPTGSVPRNSEPKPEPKTSKDKYPESTISPKPLVPVTLNTSITPISKEPSLGRVRAWRLSPTTTTTKIGVGSDILKENRNRMRNSNLNQANCPLQEISSQINLKMGSRPTNKSSKTPSSRLHGLARHTKKQFSPILIPLIPTPAVSSFPAVSVIKRVPQIIPTSTSNCNKNDSCGSIPSTQGDLEFTNASSRLQSVTTVSKAVPAPVPAPAPGPAMHSKMSDTCNTDDNYEEDLSKKLELLEALGLMPKSLFDAQRPGRYYIRKRNSVINYSETAQQAHQRCRKCCVTFDLVEQLEAHEKVCQKYKCKHCKKFYTDVESLNDHEWALHEHHPQGSLRAQLEVQAQKQKPKAKQNFTREINHIVVSKSPHKIKKRPFKNKNSRVKKKTSPKKPTGNIPILPGKDHKERLIMLIKASADSISVLSSIACENTNKVVNNISSTDENQQTKTKINNNITKIGRSDDIADLDLDLGSDSDPEPDPNLSSDSSRDQTSPADMGRLFCDVCEPIKFFNQPYQLKLHNFLKHSANNKFKCHVCSKSYRSQYDLNYHIIWHKKEIRDVEGFVPLRSSTHTQQQHQQQHQRIHSSSPASDYGSYKYK